MFSCTIAKVTRKVKIIYQLFIGYFDELRGMPNKGFFFGLKPYMPQILEYLKFFAEKRTICIS